MTAVCHYTSGGAAERHEIQDGGRRLDLRFTVDWGADDVRESHEKPLTFCSFGCLAAWAVERGDQHDGIVTQDGAS